MTRSRHTGYDAAVEAADSDDSERLAYEEALRLLMGLPDFERSMNQPGHSGFHLERMRLILDRLGSPHLASPAVHVAGTDGKGSTAAMVTSILGATGHKVGLYTSPHLHSVTERIRIGMEPIGRADFAALLRPAMASRPLGGEGGAARADELLRNDDGHGLRAFPGEGRRLPGR